MIKKAIKFIFYIFIIFFFINADTNTGASDVVMPVENTTNKNSTVNKSNTTTENNDKSDTAINDSENNVKTDEVKTNNKNDNNKIDTNTNGKTDYAKEEIKSNNDNVEKSNTKSADNDKTYDSISGASQTVDIFDLNKLNEDYVKKEEKKEVEKEQKKEIKEETKKEVENTIVLKNDKDKLFEQKKDSSMILFADKYKPDYENFNEENNQKVIKKKTVIDIPSNIDEFNKFTTVFEYDENNIIQAGKKVIDAALGEDLINIAYKEFKADNLKTAIIYFEKLIYFNYRLNDCYYYLSWCYYNEKDYYRSINYMKEAAICSEKQNISENLIADYYAQTGNMYYKIDDFNNCIMYFEKALEINPKILDIYNKIAISYYKIRNKSKAAEYWEKGKKQGDPNCKKNYEWLLKQADSP